MGAIKFIGSLTLVVLFVIAVSTFAFKFETDNDSSIGISDTGEYNRLSKLNQTIEAADTTANGKLSIFTNSSIESDADNIKTGSPFKIGTTGAFEGTINATRTGFNTLLGGDSSAVIFFTALSSILVIMAIAYAWALWKGGAA